jgi:hypothetical protein
MTKRWIVSMLAAGALGMAQEVTKMAEAPVVITSVPPVHPGGPEEMERIEGKVTVKCGECRVILFAKGGDTWWVQPFADSAYTPVVDGKWGNDTHLGTEYAAMLVTREYVPPAKAASLPKEGNGVVAVTVVPGRK